MGLGGDAPADAPPRRIAGDAPVPAAAPATPAPAPAAAVEEVKPEPPKPDPLHIQAAKRRKRIPYWAASVLAAIPLWGYVYVRTLEPPPAGEDDPLTLGAEVYGGNCSSCHGGTGGGGAGAQLSDGAVIETGRLARPAACGAWPDNPLGHRTRAVPPTAAVRSGVPRSPTACPGVLPSASSPDDVAGATPTRPAWGALGVSPGRGRLASSGSGVTGEASGVALAATPSSGHAPDGTLLVR